MELCTRLEWDSEFFGFPIARLQQHYLRPDTVHACLAWCREHAIRCLYFLANPDDQATVDLAAAHGFRLVDLRVTLERPVREPIAPSPCVRPWREEDVAALRQIAAVAHRDSRFYYDTNFPRGRCDELYQVWIERSCRGYADAVFVAELEGIASGYVTCHLMPDGSGQIGLVGVAESVRGRGMGAQLLQAALAYFRQQGVTMVRVVTQGRNTGAQRLYQRQGFLTSRIQLWYHRWFFENS